MSRMVFVACQYFFRFHSMKKEKFQSYRNKSTTVNELRRVVKLFVSLWITIIYFVEYGTTAYLSKRVRKIFLAFINVILLHSSDRHVSATLVVIYRMTRTRIRIHSFSSLSCDRFKASSKASSPHSTTWSFLLQMRLSSPFLKLIQ